MRTAGKAALLASILAGLAWTAGAPARAQNEAALPATVAPLNYQAWMNVFRRYEAPDEAMFAFYTTALGLKRLQTYGAVHRFQAGAQELKLTRRTPDRQYVRGGIDDATGVRLFTLFYPDEAAIEANFAAAGLPAPDFHPVPGSTRTLARVQDPDGQWLELVAAPGEGPEVWRRLEVGLTVSDLAKSVAFYQGFVGLDPIEPEQDPLSGATKTRFRHGATIVSLRSFGRGLPRDDGSGGIQYVISNAGVVDQMAKERSIPVEQPLSGLPGYRLRTIWLSDPDGITNYFAQVGVAETPPSE